VVVVVVVVVSNVFVDVIFVVVDIVVVVGSSDLQSEGVLNVSEGSDSHVHR